MRMCGLCGEITFDGTMADTTAVARMVEVSRTDENMIESMLEAVRAEASLGEICDALRAEWGVYREPARF